MSFVAKAVWVQRAPDGRTQFETYPSSPGEMAPAAEAHGAGRSFAVTNDPEALRELLAGSASGDDAVVLDLAELFRLAFPASSAETVAQILLTVSDAPPGAAVLWQAWEAVLQRSLGLPLWALETVELLLREVGEVALARFFGQCAAAVRDRGRSCGGWQDSFAAEALRQVQRTMPAHADCSPLDVEAVSALLQPGGPLSRLMPGYEPRPGQIEMLRSVVQSFNDARHLLVEAGTGVGKSVAYLLPAVLWAKWNDVPVVVSTNTRNLQSQLLDKDLPLVQQVLASIECRAWHVARPDAAFRIALIKGRSNYLCLRRLGGLLEHGQYEMDRAEMRSFARTIAWSVQTSSGDMDELGGGCGMDEDFLGQLASLGEECSGRGCRYYRRCFLQKARDRALRAHVVIANHALVFAEMSAPGVALPPAGQIIFDEAHNLEDAATRHFSVEVTVSRLHTLLRRLTRGGGKHAGGVLDVLRRQADKGDLGGDAGRRKALLRQIREVAAAVEHLRGAGQHLFRALYALLGDAKEPRRFQCRAGSSEPEFLVNAGADRGRQGALAALPLVTVTGNQLLSATGIKAGQTVLITGAVGNVGRSAVFTAKDLGATVIAAVLKRQTDAAKTVGADQVVATDDDAAIANLSPLDAVADTIDGATAQKLIAKVKPGGVFATVVQAPQNAAKFPTVKVEHVFSKFDRKTLEYMAEAVRDGKLVIPIGPKLPLSKAAEGQAMAEKGGIGKVMLLA